MNINKLLVIIKLLLGAIIIHLLFRKIGLKNISEALLSTNAIYLTAAFIMLILVYLAGAAGLYFLITPIKKISLFKLFEYSSISWAVGFIMPTADIVSFSYLLKKEGIDFGPGLAINFLDKAITAVVLICLSILASLKFLPINQAINFIITISALSLIGILAISPLGRITLRRFILRKYSKNFTGFWQVLKWFLLKKKTLLAANTALTLIKFIVTAAIAYLLFLPLGIQVPIYDITLITAILIITKLIPSPLNFIGLREAVGFSLVVFLYMQIGLAAPTIISVYILVFALNYLYALLTLFFVDYKPLVRLQKS